jgi:hypothetical protein
MKTMWRLLLASLCGLAVFAQQQSFIEQSLVINIEVPVRVFEGSRFVDNLTIRDFEINEDGVEQKIEAVYLIKERSIERSEEKKRFVPDTDRQFYLFFEIENYTPELHKAVAFFINDVYIPGDNLILVTPLKTYRLKENAMEAKRKEDIVDEIRRYLRSDAIQGSTEYRSTVQDIESMARDITADVQRMRGDQPGADFAANAPEEPAQQLALYAGLMLRLHTLRKADEYKLLELADYLKSQIGQKYVFMFYERKFIPQIDPSLLAEYISLFEEESYMSQALADILDYNKRESYLDFKRIRENFADSSTAIHFLHINRPIPLTPGVKMEEQSEDTYNAFREIVKATGGYSESSKNPEYLFKNALEASRNYYLIYYSPKNPRGDGAFRKIQVRIKGKDHGFRILHRAGYFDY